MAESADEGWVRPGPRKRSPIWDHFRINPEFPRQVKCAYCNTKMSVNTSTGVLALHTRKSCPDAPESAKIAAQSSKSSQSSDGKNHVSRPLQDWSLGEVKGATEEEALLGRMVALVGIPIYKLYQSTDIKKGEKMTSFIEHPPLGNYDLQVS